MRVSRRRLRFALLLSIGMLGCLVAFDSARAASINYVNPTPPPISHVFGSVSLNASGFPSPGPAVVSHASGAGLSHTTFGPNPPSPSFTTLTFGQAEMLTDLSLTGPGTSRTIAVPGFGRFVAEGTGTAVTDFYTAASKVYSGDTGATTPGTWTVFVNPTGIEIPGTPTLITLNTSIVGEVEAAGSSSADASWLVSTNLGAVMSGSANQASPGLTLFSDTGSQSFVIPLGSSFQLTLLYELDAAGTGVSNSRAEVLASTAGPLTAASTGGIGSGSIEPTTTTFNITAQVGVTAVPEPSTMSLFAVGALFMVGSRWRRKRKVAA